MAVEPFVTIGATAIVAGGIAAAVTGPTDWEHGSWVAAFLVLVVGVGQIGLATGQAALSDHLPSRRRRSVQAVVFNVGSAFVVAGTLASMPVIVAMGCVAILAGLTSFARTPRQGPRGHAWPARLYTLLLVTLIVSTPVGLVLSWRRA